MIFCFGRSWYDQQVEAEEIFMVEAVDLGIFNIGEVS